MSLIYVYKNQLETYLKNFLQNTSDYTNFNNFLFQLKNKYNDQVIHRFINNITNNLHILRVQNVTQSVINNFVSLIYINDLQIDQEVFIKDLIQFLNPSSIDELKQRIEKLEKDVNEIRDICINQNPVLVRIDENTS